MTTARKDIVAEGEERSYHCTVRCVRQSFLCGTDTHTGCNYDHRKDWIRDRLVLLSGLFALDVTGYSVMSNHFHVVPRTRPDVMREWPADEVARRWLAVFPPKRRKVDPAVAMEAARRKILSDPVRVEVLRQRLGSLSWFMRCLDEWVARRANKEDGCTGRFWEGRYKCQALLDEGALLSCLAYVDLNPIRAGLADTPEESPYTSARERIAEWKAAEALWTEAPELPPEMPRAATETVSSVETSAEEAPQTDTASLAKAPALRHSAIPMTVPAQLLASISEDAPSSPVVEIPAAVRGEDRPASSGWLCPLESQRGRKGAFRSLSLAEYLRVLDATGREIRADKKGHIPHELAPILDRLAIRDEGWVEAVADYDHRFHRVVGQVGEVITAAHAAGRRCFHGLAACRAAFGTG